MGAAASSPWLNEKALRSAAMRGDSAEVKSIVTEAQTSPDAAQHSDGRTPLFFAASGGHVGAALVLVELGAEIDLADLRGVTPLMAAASAGYSELVKLLVGMGADVNANATEIALKLHAFKNSVVSGDGGHSGGSSLSVEDKGRPIDPTNAASVTSDTSFSYINSSGGGGGFSLQPRTMGLASGATTALSAAAASGHESCVILLFELGADPLAGTTLHSSSSVAGKTFTSDGCDGRGMPDASSAENLPPLNKLASPTTTQTHISAAPAANSTISTESTPPAPSSPSTLLLLSQRLSCGSSACVLAAFQGHDRVVRLLAARAPQLVDLPNHNGVTPCLAAALFNHGHVVQTLAQLGADLDVCLPSGSGGEDALAIASAVLNFLKPKLLRRALSNREVLSAPSPSRQRRQQRPESSSALVSVKDEKREDMGGGGKERDISPQTIQHPPGGGAGDKNLFPAAQSAALSADSVPATGASCSSRPLSSKALTGAALSVAVLTDVRLAKEYIAKAVANATTVAAAADSTSSSNCSVGIGGCSTTGGAVQICVANLLPGSSWKSSSSSAAVLVSPSPASTRSSTTQTLQRHLVSNNPKPSINIVRLLFREGGMDRFYPMAPAIQWVPCLGAIEQDELKAWARASFADQHACGVALFGDLFIETTGSAVIKSTRNQTLTCLLPSATKFSAAALATKSSMTKESEVSRERLSSCSLPQLQSSSTLRPTLSSTSPPSLLRKMVGHDGQDNVRSLIMSFVLYPMTPEAQKRLREIDSTLCDK